MGCTLEVTREGTEVVQLAGNACKRGEAYAEAELRDPRRMVATTVQVSGGVHPLVPVYTTAPVPKPRIRELLAELRAIRLEAPVEPDQLVLSDALGSGVDVRASRGMPAARGATAGD
jgi:CxxC motif-containing protein